MQNFSCFAVIFSMSPFLRRTLVFPERALRRVPLPRFLVHGSSYVVDVVGIHEIHHKKAELTQNPLLLTVSPPIPARMTATATCISGVASGTASGRRRTQPTARDVVRTALSKTVAALLCAGPLLVSAPKLP